MIDDHPQARTTDPETAHAAAELKCLGRNKDGSPKHPLYLAANTQLQPWSP